MRKQVVLSEEEYEGIMVDLENARIEILQAIHTDEKSENYGNVVRYLCESALGRLGEARRCLCEEEE